MYKGFWPSFSTIPIFCFFWFLVFALYRNIYPTIYNTSDKQHHRKPLDLDRQTLPRHPINATANHHFNRRGSQHLSPSYSCSSIDSTHTNYKKTLQGIFLDCNGSGGNLLLDTKHNGQTSRSSRNPEPRDTPPEDLEKMAGAWWGTDGGGSDAGSGGDCVGDESGGGSPQPHSNGDRQHEMLEDILMTCGLTDTPALFSPTTGDDYLRTLEAFGLADLGSNETFGSGQRTEDNIIIDAFQEASHDGGISQNMSSSIHQGTPDDRRSSFTSSMAPSTPLIQETSPTVLPFTTDPLLSLSSPSPNAFTPTANTAGIPHPRHPPSGDSFASTRMRNVSAPSAMLPINSTPFT
ncbi:hypothetical protein BC829DRAFT_490364 [Chytridium lagenaria]|nr:hypothetical protein BC829DRAFT_490364 [Chytridium lagenaria]